MPQGFPIARLAAIAGLASSPAALAQTATWLAPADGLWSDGANWSGGVSPNGPGFTAEIGVTGAAYTVDLDVDADLGNLRLTSADAILDGGGGFGITVAGELRLADADVRFLSQLTAQDTLIFDSAICDDLCDSPLLLQGANGRWTGNDIRLMGTASFTIADTGVFAIQSASTIFGDPGTTITNNGLIAKSSAGATIIDGGTFVNNGSLKVRAGTFQSLNDAVDVNTLGGLFQGGLWEVGDTASIDLAGQQITTNAATVRIEGAGTFDAFTDFVTVNNAAGAIELGSNATLTTAGDFTNDGRLTIEAGSTFAVAGGSTFLSQGTAGDLNGGRYELGGTLIYDNAAISLLNAALVLDGAGADIRDATGNSALDGALTVSGTGELDIRGGRTFTAGGDLAVLSTGVLRIEDGSQVIVPAAFGLTSFVGGEFVEGVFDVRGTLQFAGAAIDTLSTDITLSGAGAQIIDAAGGDAFTPLATVTASGRLAVEDGRTLATGGTLGVDGELAIRGTGSTIAVGGDLDLGGTLRLDGGALTLAGRLNVNGGSVAGSGTINGSVVADGSFAPGASPGLLTIGGDLEIGDGAVFTFELGGTVAGSGYDRIVVSGLADFGRNDDDGAGLARVVLIDGFRPVLGDAFDIMLFGARRGAFGELELPSLGGPLFFDAAYTDVGLRLTVVPAPGAIVPGIAALTFAARRRRG